MINNNKRQADSNDFDNQDEPQIIKTIPGNQRIISMGNTGPGLNVQKSVLYK
jgi:hypothetical protein